MSNYKGDYKITDINSILPYAFPANFEEKILTK